MSPVRDPHRSSMSNSMELDNPLSECDSAPFGPQIAALEKELNKELRVKEGWFGCLCKLSFCGACCRTLFLTFKERKSFSSRLKTKTRRLKRLLDRFSKIQRQKLRISKCRFNA